MEDIVDAAVRIPLLGYRDGFDFYQPFREREAAHNGQGTRRKMTDFLEDARPDLVDDRSIFEAGREDGHFSDLLEARSRGFQNSLQVLEGLLGLKPDIAFTDKLSALVASHLARDENEISHSHGMRIGVRRRVVDG